MATKETSDDNNSLHDSSVDLFEDEENNAFSPVTQTIDHGADECQQGVENKFKKLKPSPTAENVNEVVVIDSGDMSDDELMRSTAALENSLSEPESQCRQKKVGDELQNISSNPTRWTSGHEVEVSPSKNELDFECPFCNIQESSLNSLEKHIGAEHSEIPIEALENEPWLASTSKAAAESNDVRSSHWPGTDEPQFATEYGADFTCPYCDLSLEDAVKLFEHVDQTHKENMSDAVTGTLSCPMCAFKCNFEQEMQDHVAVHESERICVRAESSCVSAGAESMMCPMCGLSMSDPDLLTAHVNSHFSSSQHSGSSSHGSSSAPQSNSKVGKSRQAFKDLQNRGASGSSSSTENSSSGSTDSWGQGRGNYKRQHERGLSKAFEQGKISVGEYHEQVSRLSRVDARDVDDGQTRVTGLIEKIAEMFRRQARADQQVYLCSPMDHFSGSYGDKGWGCGYRNFQMMLSCLMRNQDYASRIFPKGQPSMPSIPKIQEMIEAAWRLGFDPQGSQQLNGKVVKTRKWIGATEIVTTFSSLRVKCLLADFHFPSGPDGTHPRLLQWVSDYFCSNRPFKPPLYLQHQGHSRTIIGVEKEKGETKLLLFDPGNPNMAEIASSPLTWKQMRTFRRPQAAFKAKQYQIVAIVGLLSDAEYQDSKILRSERIS